MTTIQESILAELQNSNLADFAASFGAFGNTAALDGRGPHSLARQLPPLMNGARNGMPQPEQQLLSHPQSLRAPAAGPASASARTEGDQGDENPDTSTAVADALTALEASMQVIRCINSTPEVRGGGHPASSNDCSTRPSRKSARTSMEQTAGRHSNSKGLRHFSLRVCSAVENKGRTTYNEVADELVAEMRNDEGPSNFDEKNVRRRVYDAINVLMAAGIMEKQKKDIIWMGFPNVSSKSMEKLEAERAQKIADVEAKQKHLQELLEQHAGIKHLLEYNQQPAAQQRLMNAKTVVHLPFIVVKVKADRGFDCIVSDDYHDVMFDFNNASFEIHDDSYVLKNMMQAAASRPNMSPTACATSSPAFPVMSTGNSRQDSNVGNQQGHHLR